MDVSSETGSDHSAQCLITKMKQLRPESPSSSSLLVAGLRRNLRVAETLFSGILCCLLTKPHCEKKNSVIYSNHFYLSEVLEGVQKQSVYLHKLSTQIIYSFRENSLKL